MEHTHPEGRQADTEHVLDNPVYASLSSPHHAHLARGRGRVLRYLDDVAPFLGLPDHPTEQDWADAAQILGSGTAVLVHPAEPAPPAWDVIDRFDLVQMTASAVVEGAADTRAIRLEAADVPEMLDLTRRTAPGPFLRRTIELGTYIGIRQGRTLIAMAGERLRAPGWVEISAVCTAPEHQGKGLGSSLMRTLIGHITARGDNAFLHVAATNTNAVRLYKALGFTIRRELPLTVLRPPTL